MQIGKAGAARRRLAEKLGSHHSYEFCDNRIRIFLPKVINSTPTNLLQKIGTHSLQGFSSNIKRHILDEYTEICSVANCYICQRTWKKRRSTIFHWLSPRYIDISVKMFHTTKLFLLLHFCSVMALFVFFSGMKTPHVLPNIWGLGCRRRLSPAGIGDCISQNTEECNILLIPVWDAWFWQQSPTGGIRDSGTIALTDISSQFILDTWS